MIVNVTNFFEFERYEKFLPDNSSPFFFGEKTTRFFSFFLHPLIPFLLVLMYWFLSESVIRKLILLFKIKSESRLLKVVTIIHSSLLAVYSAWTFYNSIMLIIPIMTHGYHQSIAQGFYETLIDEESSVWNNFKVFDPITKKIGDMHLGLGYWITHFYISKFYEFIDTWIVLFKGKEPSFLQTFHHAGIVILMWMIVVTRSTCSGLLIVVLNSFIHTLMYTYYTLAAFGFKSVLKRYLTQAQIIQFLIGIGYSIPTYWYINQAQFVSLAFLHLYTIVLISLFYRFYVETYKERKGEAEANAIVQSQTKKNR